MIKSVTYPTYHIFQTVPNQEKDNKHFGLLPKMYRFVIYDNSWYLNFFVNKKKIANVIIKEFSENNKYGKSNIGNGKNIVVDYSWHNNIDF